MTYVLRYKTIIIIYLLCHEFSMSLKSKGISAERELIHLFWKNKWAAHRIAGSGSSHYPSPDIIAGNVLRKVAIECKSSRSTTIYLEKREIDELKQFCALFGAEPWIAVRFLEEPWYVVNVEDLRETPAQYGVSLTLAKQKGLLFDEFIK